MFGATAVDADREREEGDRGGIDRADRAVHGPADEDGAAEHEPDPGRRPHQPEAERARVEGLLGEHDLGDVDRSLGDHRQVPDDEDDEQRRGAAHERDPVDHVAPVPPRERLVALEERRRDAREQERRDAEADRVHPVGEVRAGGGDDDPADERAGGRRHPLRRLEQEVRLRQVVVGDEVRHAREQGRPEERVADACDEGEPDDRAGGVGERQGGEDPEPEHVRADEQELAREPVDERAAEEAHERRRDDRRGVQSREPEPRAGTVEDVDVEGDDREPRAGARAEAREEHQSEPGGSMHEREGACGAAEQGLRA